MYSRITLTHFYAYVRDTCLYVLDKMHVKVKAYPSYTRRRCIT